MARGKVIQWNGQTGFLSDQNDSARVFFGDRNLRGLSSSDIRVGLELEFDRGQSERGPRANNIRPIGASIGNASGNQNSGNPSRREEPQSRVDIRSESPATWILPHVTQALIRGVRLEDRHPGIQLDRLSLPGDQKLQLIALNQFARTTGDRNCFSEVANRRSKLLQTVSPNETWTQKSSGPLTLHLSRSNALENAGLALHPVYGFAYLPGSGLKGMARAIAETELGLGQKQIIEIFGSDVDNRKSEDQRAGNVCFHDAWPVAWPKIFVDIVNNHHPDYYEGKDAPGDWESPNPVYFLAIESLTAFRFFLSARRRDTPIELLHEAAKCLRTALTEAGAGAKTAAGYGWFQPNETDSQPLLTRSVSCKMDLTLDSPAFLARAERTHEGCELRSASLRGQLRSWWRTLHAGCLSVDDLRSLEAALWGDTKAGGAIRFSIEPTSKPEIEEYKHPSQRESGVRYLAYGMDDGATDSKQVRMIMRPGMTWDLTVRIRGTSFNHLSIARERVVEQFEAALGLLVKFGGVGAKSRKGFGSLSVSGGLSLQTMEQWKLQSTELRRELNKDLPFSADNAESAGLFDPHVQIIELKFKSSTAFDALEHVGRAYKSVSGSYKHRVEKITLGLPRKIHGPTNNPMSHQDVRTHQPPKWLDFSKRSAKTKPSDARHSSPIHVHLEKNSSNEYTIRLVLFPMKYLPSRDASIAFLRNFADAFTLELKQVIEKESNSGSRSDFRSVRPAPTRAISKQVQVTILEEKQLSGKTGYKVQEDGKRSGMLIDGDQPMTLPKVGDRVMVYWVSTSDANSPRYRWSPPTQNPPSRGNQRGDNRR